MTGRMAAWLSPNPERAWAERFFLAYTPYWISCVALVMLTGMVGRWGDVGLLLFGLAMGVPAWLGPYVASGRPDRHGTPTGSS